MESLKLLLVALVTAQLLFGQGSADKGHEKYSKKANTLPDSEIYEPDFRNIQRPFRMAKLNLVWTKAQHVSTRCGI